MPVIATSGGTTIVFSFKVYDIASDEYKVSSRYGTAAGIESINGVRTGPSFEIPQDDVDSDGLTIKGYEPAADS